MTTRAFIVHVETDDTADLNAEAMHMQDILLDNGWDVQSVTVWQSPGQLPPSPEFGSPIPGLG